MPRLDKIPTLWTALGIFLIAGHFAMVCLARDFAFFKASLSDYFLNPTERADAAIDLLQNRRAYLLFTGFTVLLLTALPLLVRAFRTAPWAGALLALVLYIPGLYYGREILHVSGKFIDWQGAMDEVASEASGDP